MTTDADALDRAVQILRGVPQADLADEVEKIAALLRDVEPQEQSRRIPVLRDGKWVLDPEPGDERRGSLDNLNAALRAQISAPPQHERLRERAPPSPAADLDRLPLAIRSQMVATRTGRP